MTLGTTRILIVDDLSGTRGIVREMLTEMGLTDIVEAGSGEEAIELLRDGGASLILSDYNMGAMSGTDFMKRVKADPKLAPIPFVMISSQVDPTVMKKVLDDGAAAYITKPLRFDVVEHKILEILRRRMPFEV